MKTAKEAESLYALVRATSPGTAIFVCAEYAHHFRSLPVPDRYYLVQDPLRKSVIHSTTRDGSYTLLNPRVVRPGYQVHPMRVKGALNKAKTRLAEQVLPGRRIRCASTLAEPEICLIDIRRVIRICGFQKSFIYAQNDFPKPVRLGTSRRSAVRWVEHEVVAWTKALADSR